MGFDEHNLLLDYKKILDESCIVSEADVNGVIIYVNDKFCDISGYTRDELIGKKHNIVKHPDSSVEMFVDMWETISSGKTWHGTIKNRRKDGEFYFVKTTITPVVDTQGQIVKFISVRFDVTDLYSMMELVREQRYDGLTGLQNRTRLLQKLKVNNKVILALVNIDGFRDLNEIFGHDFCDKVLIEFSKELLSIAKSNDVYRVGGDEFAIVDDSTFCIDSFYEVCSCIISRFEERPLVVDDFEIELGVRIGATCFVENPLAVAEIALDRASESRTNFYVVSDTSEHDSRTKDNIFWIKKLKEAIRQDKLVVYAQKIVPLGNIDEIPKYECLVRMVAEEGSVIAPYVFLDRARKAKLYTSITKAVITKSFDFFHDYNASFSINLSIEDLQNRELVKFMLNKISSYGIADKLIIEIVESDGITDFEYVNTVLSSLKSRGVKIAIDDFGTGYSNFEYIIKLNADYIKIDGSLIKNIDTDMVAFKTVEVIVAFAKKIGIKCIAEFVHSVDVATKLEQIGIDYMQGYLLHKPTALENL